MAEIKIEKREFMALIQIEKMLKDAATPVPQFLHWVADRLTMQFGDPEQVDFVQTLRHRASQLFEISASLGIDRGPERLR